MVNTLKEVKMSFLSNEQKKRIPALYSQEEVEDPIVFIKLNIMNSFWLITELDPDKELGFGWCCLGGDIQMAELGYVSLEEIESTGYEVGIEEIEKSLSQVKKELGL